MRDRIPIVIPAFEPDEKMIHLLERLQQAGLKDVVIVDDGSSYEKQVIFEYAKERYGCTVLHHEINRGKGRALKTAFSHCISVYPDLLGVITLDADGQHRVEDMLACRAVLEKNPHSLVMGCRDFSRENVPFRSRFGNRLTSLVFAFLVGVSVSDTQTGLRGIGFSFMEKLIEVKGERFEFETNMLITAKEEKISIHEVKIATIYLEENKSSHFNPVKDSLRIYASFGKFLFSSLSSSVVDLVLFSMFCGIFRERSLGSISYLVVATVLARICSAIYNFMINYKIVFQSEASLQKALLRYTLLALMQMSLSAFLVSTLSPLFWGAEVGVKVPVDVMLFLGSFLIQREFVYDKK